MSGEKPTAHLRQRIGSAGGDFLAQDRLPGKQERREAHHEIAHAKKIPCQAASVSTGGAFLPQHRLYFWPDLHGQGALRGKEVVFAGRDWVCFAELFSGAL